MQSFTSLFPFSFSFSFFFFFTMKSFCLFALAIITYFTMIISTNISSTSLISVLLLIIFPLFPTLVNLLFITILPSGGFAWRNHNTKNLPGPISWPFLGLLPQMAFSDHPHRKLASIANSLSASRLMAFSLGLTRVVISSHPDTAKEILSSTSFSDRPIKESARLLLFERAIGFAPSNGYWRHLRRIAASHMFSPRRVSGLECVRSNLAEGMIGKVKKEMEIKGEVDFRRVIRMGSLGNVLETVFGNSSNNNNNNMLLGEELGFMVKEGYELISEFNWNDYLPFLGYLLFDFGGAKKRCYKLAGKVNCVIGEIIKERKKDGDFSTRNDFLSVWLSLPQEDQISDADLVAVLWVCTFSLYSLSLKICVASNYNFL